MFDVQEIVKVSALAFCGVAIHLPHADDMFVFVEFSHFVLAESSDIEKKIAQGTT